MKDKEKQVLEFITLNEHINSIPDKVFKMMLEGCINRKQPLEFVAGGVKVCYKFGVNCFGSLFTSSYITFVRVGPELDMIYRRSLAMQLAAKTARVNVKLRDKLGGCWHIPIPIDLKQ